MVIAIPLLILSTIFGLIANGVVTNYIVEHPNHNPFSTHRRSLPPAKPAPPPEDPWIECGDVEGINWHGWDNPFLQNALQKVYNKEGPKKLHSSSFQDFITKFNLLARLHGYSPKDFKI